MNGDADDSSTNSHHGSISGANCNAEGRLGLGCEFDGIDDYIQVNHDPDYFVSEGTIAFWFNMNDNSVNNLFAKDLTYCVGSDGGDDCGHLSLGYNRTTAPNKISMRFQNDGNGAHYHLESTSSSFDPGIWYHVTVTFNSAGFRLFINGLFDAENNADFDGNFEGMEFNDAPIIFGVDYNQENGLNGKMDEIGFWDRVLTDQEIIDIVTDTANPSGNFESDLINVIEYYDVDVAWGESGSGVSLEVSVDGGSQWCDVDNGSDIVGTACFSQLPSSVFKYKIMFDNHTNLDYVNFDFEILNTTELECNDGIDNDGDIAIDMEDTDCYLDGTIYYISNDGNNDWNGQCPVYDGGNCGPYFNRTGLINNDYGNLYPSPGPSPSVSS